MKVLTRGPLVLFGTIAIALGFAGHPGAVLGATLTVDATQDAVDANPGDTVCADAGGACTLRAAVMEANALPGADTITLPAGTYALSIPGTGEDASATGDLDVTDGLAIDGSGSATTIIDGADLDRVIQTLPGADLTLNSVAVQNGNTDGQGGGILAGSALALNDSSVISNQSYWAAGIAAANLSLTNTHVDDNAAVFYGGGVSCCGDDGTFSIVNSTINNNVAVYAGGIALCCDGTVSGSAISGNVAHHDGGIVASSKGTISITNTTISNNVSLFQGGGGLSLGGEGNGSTTIAGSTISGNESGHDGGGINICCASNPASTYEGRIMDTTISGNRSGSTGGGIYSKEFRWELDNVSITNNSSTYGGGIFNAARLSLTNSSVGGNSAAFGGGILNENELTVTDTTISGNKAVVPGAGIGDCCSSGGGITNAGKVSLSGTTLSGNTATFNGGGINNNPGSILFAGAYDPVLDVANSTISNNTAAIGGGVYNADESGLATAVLTNVTVANNTATVNAGGIASGTHSTTSLHNTIVGNNSAADCAGNVPVTSLGHNLASDGTCNLTTSGDFPSFDARLDPLADNGGPTQTHALISGSPAIDTGDNAGCPVTDQRGFVRPQDTNSDGISTCDIGATEEAATLCPGGLSDCPLSEPPPPPAPIALPPTGGPAKIADNSWPITVVASVSTVAAASFIIYRRRSRGMQRR